MTMTWRGTQAESRARYLQNFDADDVARYERWVVQLTENDLQACRSDIATEFTFRAGMSVLDVGAGTGAMCKILAQIQGLKITALEPSNRMLDCFRAKKELRGISIVAGFCDSYDDQSHFSANSFDAIVSRQLVNSLFDPLAAFRNWLYWLKPGGAVIMIDGIYDRDAWQGSLQTEVDALPLSACRTMATAPYLMESVGLQIQAVKWMEATNQMPSTRTKRYMVVAVKRKELQS
ncbi:MAG: class I SAM-dependent methyltransferase [Pirellulaceae bacterium]|nr:class I SAM-dependent methyltransferase [Pirellulaceae bacterium]